MLFRQTLDHYLSKDKNEMIHKKFELIYFINLCEKKHNKLKMFTLGDSMPL